MIFLKSYVECPICKKQYKILTNSHIKRHGLTMEEFNRLYPDVQKESLNSKEKRKQSISKVWEDDDFRQRFKDKLNEPEIVAKMSKKGIANWEDKDKRSRRVATMKRVANTSESKEKFSRQSIETWKNPVFREKRVNGIREALNKDSYRELQRLNSLKMWRDSSHPKKVLEGYANSTIAKSIELDLGDIKLLLRSSYEVTVVKHLNSLGIDFEYEEHRFSYLYGGYYHSYYPDFYLPKYNVFIEVKPESLEDDEINILKLNSVISSGYNIFYVDERHLKDVESFNKRLCDCIPQRLSESNKSCE